MSKNLLQDIVKIKNTRSEISPIRKGETKGEAENTKKPNSKYTLWTVAGVSVLFLFFALSYIFARVVVTIDPKIKSVSLKENLLASKNPSDPENILSFDLVTLSGEENKIVKGKGEKDVSQKSKGLVVVYNNFSNSIQRLDINTRLEGSNGKIYKTEKAVIVPGMSGTTPGSIEVFVDAAEAGADYNSGPLDFKIFGFKGTPKYEKFYARSKGDIAGGLQGKYPYVSDDQKNTIINQMKSDLQAKLFKKASDQIPEGFILFKDATFLNTDAGAIDTSAVTADTLPLKLKGTMYGFLLNKDKLIKKIAKDNIANYDGSEVALSGIQNLSFSLSGKDNVSFADTENINFSLSGSTKIYWKLDTSKLISDLLGKSKNDFSRILLSYPYVDSAKLEISPIWKMTFPEEAKNIKIIVNYPE